MAQRTLIILTHSFPVKSGENWLNEEVKHINGDWADIQVFCEANVSAKSLPEYPQFNFLPNAFIYKRSWVAFFDASFINALFYESLELIRKRKFFKTIKDSVSVLMRAYSMAKWFNEKYIEKGKKYLLYCYWGDELTIMACLLKTMNSNVSVVCRVHGIDVYEERTRLKHIQFRYFQLKHLKAMFSVSRAGADYITKRYPKFAKKIKVSYLGTGEVKLNPIPSKQRLELITCALLRNVKRMELIVDILKHVKAPTRWTFAGGGTGFEEFKQKCKNLPPHIETDLGGILPQNELQKLYEERPLHYYLSVSSTEGLPVAMMECISHGVPIISTDVGGCKEIVTEKTGILIPVDFKPEEVAKLLDELYLNYDYSPEKRKSIHDEWNRKFNARNNYKDFYKEIEQ